MPPPNPGSRGRDLVEVASPLGRGLQTAWILSLTALLGGLGAYLAGASPGLPLSSGALLVLTWLLSSRWSGSFSAATGPRQLLYRAGFGPAPTTFVLADFDDVEAVTVSDHPAPDGSGYPLSIHLASGVQLDLSPETDDRAAASRAQVRLRETLQLPAREPSPGAALPGARVGSETASVLILPAPSGRLRPSKRAEALGLGPLLAQQRKERALAAAVIGATTAILAATVLATGALGWLLRARITPFELLLAGALVAPLVVAALGGAALVGLGLEDLGRLRGDQPARAGLFHSAYEVTLLAPIGVLLTHLAAALMLILVPSVLAPSVATYGVLIADLYVLKSILGEWPSARVAPALPALVRPLSVLSRAELTTRLGEGEVTCGYCAAPLAVSEAVACRACEAMQHRDCWAEGGRCATYACPSTDAQAVAPLAPEEARP